MNDTPRSDPAPKGPTRIPSAARADGHLDTERLIAYRSHELPPEEEASIQDHLLLCQACREEAVGVNAFLDEPEKGEASVEFDREAHWRRLRPRLQREVWPAPRVAVARGPRRDRSPWVLPLALAATLAAVGFSGFLGLIVGIGGPTKTLTAIDSRRGGAQGQPDEVTLPRSLRLRSPLTAAKPSYRLEIRDESGRLVRTYVALREREFRIRVRLWRFSLEPGLYRLVLYGEEGEQAQQVGEYRLRIR